MTHRQRIRSLHQMSAEDRSRVWYWHNYQTRFGAPWFDVIPQWMLFGAFFLDPLGLLL